MAGCYSVRCLRRNKKVFYYSNFIKKDSVKDDKGFDTGEFRLLYTEPKRVKGHVSAARGISRVEQFGSDLRYDKIIYLDKPKFPMDENSILFVDKKPEYDEDENPLNDYVVIKVARSLNSVAYAIRRIERQ